MLRVHHGEGTSERAHIDEEVKVDVDACSCRCGVDNLLAASFVGTHIGLGLAVLLGNEGRNVGLESSRADAHYHQANGEDGNGDFGVDNDGRNRRHDENNVAHEGGNVGVLNREVAAPVLIREVCAEQRGAVGPELVEGSHAGRGPLAHSEGTRARLLEETGAGL